MEEGATLGLRLLLQFQFSSKGPVWPRSHAESGPCVNHPDSHTNSSFKPVLLAVSVCMRSGGTLRGLRVCSEVSVNQTQRPERLPGR